MMPTVLVFSMSGKAPPNGQNGFSLLEMLVAFSILSVALGILLNIFSRGAQTAVAAEEYTAAVQIAESLMAKTGVEKRLLPGQTGGIENNKYFWQVNVSPYQLFDNSIDANAIPAQLFLVTINVSWGDGASNAGFRQRVVELTTLKIASKSL